MKSVVMATRQQQQQQRNLMKMKPVVDVMAEDTSYSDLSSIEHQAESTPLHSLVCDDPV